MSNLENMHQKALAQYEQKDLENALKTYQEIIMLNPADEVALSCVMDIYLELDDKFNYYLARANVNIAQNKLEYAINDTKKALDLDMENIDTRRKLARLYRVDNKPLKAIDEFLRILELSDKELDVYFELADLYMRQDSIESAIDIAKKGLDVFPSDANLKNMLAQLYFKANDYKAALEVVEDELLKIKILLQDSQNDKAKESLSKIDFNRLNELQKRNYFILSAQYLYNTSQYQEALSEIDAYCALSAPDAVSFQMRALIYEELKDDFNAHLNWGFCYKIQGKFDDAIVEFDHAYQENSSDKTVLIELAKLYEQNKERFVAMEYWQKVYDIDNDPQAKEVLAEFYYSQGNFEKAEQYGKKVEKKEENYTGLIDK